MRIAIIGAGSVGATLGRAWIKLGEDVIWGVRNPADPKHATLPKERVKAPAEAIKEAEVVVMAIAGDHLLHAHFVGWQTAIVMKGMARTSARAPGHLSGLADAKVEQHCHRYGHYDDH